LAFNDNSEDSLPLTGSASMGKHGASTQTFAA
jgi:hypothetical protein